MIGIGVRNFFNAADLRLDGIVRIAFGKMFILLDSRILLSCRLCEKSEGFFLHFLLLNGIELNVSCVLNELANEVARLCFLRRVILRYESSRLFNLSRRLVDGHDIGNDTRFQGLHGEANGKDDAGNQKPEGDSPPIIALHNNVTDAPVHGFTRPLCRSGRTSKIAGVREFLGLFE